jgi:HNH endonuclease
VPWGTDVPSLYVGVTDKGWYERLSTTPNVDEVNFWRPGGRSIFRALVPGELFLFKLHSPDNYIVGGGLLAHSNRLPVSFAWDAFRDKNGVASLDEMLQRLAHYSPSVRELPRALRLNHQIGCVLLSQPFFLERSRWIAVRDWQPNIVQGRRYDLASEEGQRLLDQVQSALQAPGGPGDALGEPRPRYGAPMPVRPRLGQGGFRVLVTDAYQRRCAITGEPVLPVLQAAHIRPYAEGGEHRVPNGLLLRSDLHTLFDRGYVTVDEHHRVEVSRRLRDDFANGAEYYAMRGRRILLPRRVEDHPDPELLRWHNERFSA